MSVGHASCTPPPSGPFATTTSSECLTKIRYDLVGKFYSNARLLARILKSRTEYTHHWHKYKTDIAAYAICVFGIRHDERCCATGLWRRHNETGER